jgi:hypothetical protein
MYIFEDGVMLGGGQLWEDDAEGLEFYPSVDAFPFYRAE